MRTFYLISLFLSSYSMAGCQNATGTSEAPMAGPVDMKSSNRTGIDGASGTDSTVFRQHLKSLKRSALANGYSTRYALLIDLGVHSGSKRAFFMDLEQEKVLHAGLVTHGSSTSTLPLGGRQYSNLNGSLCSSLGKYRIGKPYQGNFGLAYKLYGLDTSNSNAFARFVVLHSHSCVPDAETEDPICQSWGCPTVSPLFLRTISGYLDASAKPILLDIFDSHQR